MRSKDFLVVEPGLTYFYISERVTPQQLAQAKKEGMFDPVAKLKVAPYTQKLQRKLKLIRKLDKLADKNHKERYGEFADYVMRDGTPNPMGNYPICYEAHKEEIEEITRQIGRQSKDLC